MGSISECGQHEQRRFRVCTAWEVNAGYNKYDRAQHRKWNFRVYMTKGLIGKHAMGGISGHALGSISDSAQHE